jgi:hypothetical protein
VCDGALFGPRLLPLGGVLDGAHLDHWPRERDRPSPSRRVLRPSRWANRVRRRDRAGLCLLTRLAGLAIFGDMVITMITVTWATGINSGNPPPGYQLNLALGVLALVVGMFGAGRFSVDSVIAHRLAKRQPPDEQTTVTGRQSPLATTPPTMLESPSSGKTEAKAPPIGQIPISMEGTHH